ncbi:MAG: sulfatase-like hydrolase/transferase [Deltaproteobacteria bacterium]|nr:sulfatase-like hydrolase/transferase [Deltaproteobacteria bacterium]
MLLNTKLNFLSVFFLEKFDLNLFRYRFSFGFAFLLLLTGIISLLITKRSLQKLSQFLTISTGLLAGYTLIVSLSLIFSYALATFQSTKNLPTKKESQTTSQYPDIFYVVVDEFAGFSTLNAYFKFDTQEIENEFKKLGFIIPYKSFSNYPTTANSLPSTLNFEYSHTLYKQQNMSLTQATKSLAQNTRILKFLKNKGYKTIHIGGASGYYPTEYNPYADINISARNHGFFQNYLLVHNRYINLVIDTSIISPVIKKWATLQHYKSSGIPLAFEILKKISKKKQPQFIYCHILSPHTPYFFDEDGNLNPPNIINEAHEINSAKKYYLKQLRFVASKLLGLAHSITDKYKGNVVIIFQSDHGSGFQLYEDGTPTSAASTSPPAFQERFFNLNLIYLKKECEHLIYDHISNVNILRVLLNCYFNAKLPLLEDKAYFSGLEHIIPTFDITPQLFETP